MQIDISDTPPNSITESKPREIYIHLLRKRTSQPAIPEAPNPIPALLITRESRMSNVRFIFIIHQRNIHILLNSAGFLSLTIHAVSKGFTISSTRKYRRSRSPRFCSLSCSTGFLRFRYRDVYIALDVSAPTDNNNPARLPAKSGHSLEAFLFLIRSASGAAASVLPPYGLTVADSAGCRYCAPVNNHPVA